MTLNNTGYAMVRQAREMVAAGELGRIVAVHAAYIQDWLTKPIDADGQKQAEWRTDPARAGSRRCSPTSACMPSTSPASSRGREAEAVAADLFTAVPGRRLDDNANVLVRWTGGARGTLLASQTSPGHYNDLSVRIYGDKAGLEWSGARPEELRFSPYGEESARAGARRPWRRRREPAGVAHAGSASGGLYRGLRQPLPRRSRRSSGATAAAGGRPGAGGLVPDVEDGARGVKFVAAAVASNRAGGAWTAARFG